MAGGRGVKIVRGRLGSRTVLMIKVVLLSMTFEIS